MPVAVYSFAVTRPEPVQNRDRDAIPATIAGPNDRGADLDRVRDVDRGPAPAGPGWSRVYERLIVVLALVLAVVVVATIVQLESSRVSAVSSTFVLLGSLLIVSIVLSLYSVGITWIILIGRRLRELGRPGAHLRLPAVALFMAMPLALCATDLFAVDAGEDSFGNPTADFRHDAVFVGVMRMLLAFAIVRLAVAVRRGTDRLLTAPAAAAARPPDQVG
jgi:hypothetical protein